MPAFHNATVVAITAERPGLQRVLLQREAGDQEPERAYVLTDVIGPVAVGDPVVMNTTAVDLGLGTGGWHVVHWNLARDHFQSSGPGHVMKLRYTSVQLDTGVEEERRDHATGTTLGGAPVVACLLHSHVPVLATTIKHLRPSARVVYVMTDQAALPLALSDTVFDLRSQGLLDLTITAGQAFGGDREAVNLASALMMARVEGGADVIIVGQGPGVVGTGSELGFSGLECVAILEEAERNGGVPILALRWSDADERDRHRGLSHHAATVLAGTKVGVHLAVPAGRQQISVDGTTCHAVRVPDVAGLAADRGVELRSMGRGPADDESFFMYASAAGVLACDFLDLLQSPDL